MIRSAIRQLLTAADAGLWAELRTVLTRDDDYGSAGKPKCDWDDPTARCDLVLNSPPRPIGVWSCLDGRELGVDVARIGELLAAVVGQDFEAGDDGRFRIARRVARDRSISTVDPQARHGHKTAAPRCSSASGGHWLLATSPAVWSTACRTRSGRWSAR